MSPLSRPRFIPIIILFMMAGFFSGCDREKRTDEDSQKPPAKPTLVSLSPNVTEILYAIGAGDNLVGVTSFCDYPPEAKEKRSVGGLIDTNMEVILSLAPDIVIDLDTQDERTRRMRELDLKVVTVSNETLFDVLQAITTLGELVGREEQASALRLEMERSLNSIREKIPPGGNPTVAFVVDHGMGMLQDVFVVGSRNFVDELIIYAGGENVFTDLGRGYHQVGQEAFYKRDPDVIFDVTKAGEDVYSDLDSLSAVKNGRVYYSFDNIIQVPGPRLILSLTYMAKKLHPEINFDVTNDGS